MNTDEHGWVQRNPAGRWPAAALRPCVRVRMPAVSPSASRPSSEPDRRRVGLFWISINNDDEHRFRTDEHRLSVWIRNKSVFIKIIRMINIKAKQTPAIERNRTAGAQGLTAGQVPFDRRAAQRHERASRARRHLAAISVYLCSSVVPVLPWLRFTSLAQGRLPTLRLAPLAQGFAFDPSTRFARSGHAFDIEPLTTVLKVVKCRSICTFSGQKTLLTNAVQVGKEEAAKFRVSGDSVKLITFKNMNLQGRPVLPVLRPSRGGSQRPFTAYGLRSTAYSLKSSVSQKGVVLEGVECHALSGATVVPQAIAGSLSGTIPFSGSPAFALLAFA